MIEFFVRLEKMLAKSVHINTGFKQVPELSYSTPLTWYSFPTYNEMYKYSASNVQLKFFICQIDILKFYKKKTSQYVFTTRFEI